LKWIATQVPLYYRFTCNYQGARKSDPTGKIQVKQAKVVLNKVEGAAPGTQGQSAGFGFVEFFNHKHALGNASVASLTIIVANTSIVDFSCIALLEQQPSTLRLR